MFVVDVTCCGHHGRESSRYDPDAAPGSVNLYDLFFSAADLQTQVPRVVFSFSLSHTDSSAPCVVSPLSHTDNPRRACAPPRPTNFIGSQCVHACASSLGLQLLQ